MLSDLVAAPTAATRSMPQTLFEGDFEQGTIDAANYDTTADQQRFIMVTGSDHAADQPMLHVLINWFGTLNSLVPATPR